jgi:hypothetical protein
VTRDEWREGTTFQRLHTACAKLRIRVTGTRAATCAHEAGHAVAADALGIAIDVITTWPFNGLDGGFWEAWMSTPAAPQSRVILHLAGAVAEALFTGRPEAWVLERYAAHDWARAVEIMDDTEAAVRRLLPATRSLVQERIDEIDLVSAALLRERDLSGAQVEEILGRHWRAQRRLQRRAS